MGKFVHGTDSPGGAPPPPSEVDRAELAALVELLRSVARRLDALAASPVPRPGTVVLHLDEAGQALQVALLGLEDCLSPNRDPPPFVGTVHPIGPA
jgi:hypothetical protein